MNFPDGVVGVVGAEEAEDELRAAFWWEGPGVGLDCGLTMAAPPSVEPMMGPTEILQTCPFTVTPQFL